MKYEENSKIEVSFIIEMLGKPKEHLKNTLERLIEKLGNETGVKIINKTIHEPKKLERNLDEKQKEIIEKIKEKTKHDSTIHVTEDLFITFAEIEAEFENLENLLFVTFNYMPSNVEIIKPESFIIKNSYFGDLLTGIILRLHKYDEIAKKLTIDKAIIEGKLRELIEKNSEKFS